MSYGVKYIGMDVHKEAIVIGSSIRDTRAAATCGLGRYSIRRARTVDAVTGRTLHRAISVGMKRDTGQDLAKRTDTLFARDLGRPVSAAGIEMTIR
jgi:hypothetical protein